MKFDEVNELVRPMFKSFYICSKVLKMTFMSCRKFIGLDGYLLKGVSRDQLLIIVAKDGNPNISTCLDCSGK